MPYATFLRLYDTDLKCVWEFNTLLSGLAAWFWPSPPAGVKITLSFHSSETEPLF